MEEEGQWRVTVEHEDVQRDEYCHVLVSSQGVLVHENWPAAPERKPGIRLGQQRPPLGAVLSLVWDIDSMLKFAKRCSRSFPTGSPPAPA